MRLASQAAIHLIRLYQRLFSPYFGLLVGHPTAGCRYYPSCSEYALQAIHKHGLLKGSAKGLWRVLRCNPFSRGGVDEA